MLNHQHMSLTLAVRRYDLIAPPPASRLAAAPLPCRLRAHYLSLRGCCTPPPPLVLEIGNQLSHVAIQLLQHTYLTIDPHPSTPHLAAAFLDRVHLLQRCTTAAHRTASDLTIHTLQLIT